MSAMFLVLACVSLRAGTLTQQAAEKIASDYLRAFFRDEIETAADFLAPSLLESLKTQIIASASSANDSEKASFAASIGFSDFDSLKNANSKEIFVRLTKQQRAAQSEFRELAKTAVVKVLNSKVEPAGARVNLEIAIKGIPNQPSSVLVGEFDGKPAITGM